MRQGDLYKTSFSFLLDKVKISGMQLGFPIF